MSSLEGNACKYNSLYNLDLKGLPLNILIASDGTILHMGGSDLENLKKVLVDVFGE